MISSMNKKTSPKRAKAIKQTKPKTQDGLPFGPGDAILIRTVTMIDVGRVTAIGPDYIILEDASWIADTERFEQTLKTGACREVERFPVPWVLVGRGAIVDVAPWKHGLPLETK